MRGFGHRVYRAEDPRARQIRDGVAKLSREMGQPQWYDILAAVVAAMSRYARHGINVNVDFYAAVYCYLGGKSPVTNGRVQLFHVLQCVRDKGLDAEAGVHRHNQREVE